MIIKNLTRKNNSGQLLKYILRYILDEKKQDDKPFLIRHNIRSRSLKGYIKEFESNEFNRIHKRSNQTALHHVILSWSDKDTKYITEPMLKDMAKQYITARGENNLYLGTVHKDRNHIHIHLAISGSKLDRTASRISKQKLADIKIMMDAYQREKYPELINSLPKHGKKKELIQAEVSKNLDKQRRKFSKKDILINTITNIKEQAQSQDNFLSLLELNGYRPYFRGANKSLTGINHEGRKYRFKTLGLDVKTIESNFRNATKESQELEEIQHLRRKIKERSQLKEKEEIEEITHTATDHQKVREFVTNSSIQGFGEVSPYEVFSQEELSFTR